MARWPALVLSGVRDAGGRRCGAERGEVRAGARRRLDDARKRDAGRGNVRAKEYDVLRRAVTNGVAFGWRHAYKHADTCPPLEEEERVKEHLVDEVMSAVCEWFDFEPTNDEE